MEVSEAAGTVYGGGAQHDESPHNQRSQSKSKFQDQSASSPLNKQSSILSLTLDEIQLNSGKSFGSMNMDEFLNNLWNNNVDDEEDQLVNDHIETKPSIPTQLCKKTVEEVWSEIRKDDDDNNNNHQPQHETPPQGRQPTFGEITLEEFLIKAGVVQQPLAAAKTSPPPSPSPHSPQKMAPPMQSSSNDACLVDVTYGGMMGLTCPMMALGFSTQQPSIGIVGTNLLVNGYSAYPIYASTRIVRELANENEKSLGPKESRKRLIDDPHEVVVERRQQRMIKNRESAARSRARKQVK